MNDQDQLASHAKHIPKLLREQILCGLMSKYVVSGKTSENTEFDNEKESKWGLAGSSIQRFHGSLLFVDISGFTALSLKLDVETLKNHINEYFTKMLDIVDKWDGDVVKFAGDALYIVWPTYVSGEGNSNVADHSSLRSSASISNNAQFATSAKKGLEKAVACALEINSACGHYEIRFADNSSENTNTGILSKLLPSFTLNSLMGGSKVSPSSDDVAYLNVHAGVSCGLMAGVDLIANNRAEFFLVGNPLIGVAMAESSASKGDVVLCPAAHELLHGDNVSLAIKGHLKSGKEDQTEAVLIQANQHSHVDHDNTLFCGCSRTSNGMFQISKLLTKVARSEGKLRKSRSSKFASHNPNGEDSERKMKIYETIQSEMENLLLSAQSSIRREFFEYLSTLEEAQSPLRTASSDLGDRKAMEKKYATFIREHLKTHFMDWMTHSLLTNVTFHVHEVARLIFANRNRRRMSSFHHILRNSIIASPTTHDVTCDASNSDSVDDSTGAKMFGRANSGIKQNLDDELDSNIHAAKKMKGSASASSFKAQVHLGEVRNVIVMFVKIEKFDLKLEVDTAGEASSFSYNRFSFLDRTESEQETDAMLLNRFQACFEVLCKSLSDQGGQLRQFIVDDKGTVCIGTFGLRGSAAVDNAAAALESAKLIVEGLKSLDLKASIGITSGKAYCGLVGSFLRHEYAVMGPSTNLSARLMCKAPAHGIICDADTVSRDRTHKFVFLSEIQAKGYTKAVLTYCPVAIEKANESDRKIVHASISSFRVKERAFGRSSLRNTWKEAAGMVKQSNLSSSMKSTAFDRLMSVTKSDFYIKETIAKLDSAAQERTISQKLFGREEEIRIIFSHIFQNDTENVDLISYKENTKILLISGPSGVGKAALVDGVDRKWQQVIRSDECYNFLLLHSRQSSVVNNDMPFRSWHSLFQKVLLAVEKKMAEMIRLTQMGDQPGAISLSKFADFRAVINYIWPMLPDEWQNRKDLLKFLDLQGFDNVPDGSDPEIQREVNLEACAKLITAIFSVSAKILEKLIVVILMDVQCLDLWSLKALNQLCLHGQGLAILATYNTSRMTAIFDGLTINELEATVNLPSNAKEGCFDFFSQSITRIIPLKPLSKTSTMAMVKEIINELSVEDCERVYSLSAGNPLYITELIKSLSKARSDNKTLDTVLHDGEKEAHSYLIEELIYYRLDKLSLSAQTVLKAVAVAVSYGRRCSFSTLVYMFKDNDVLIQQSHASDDNSVSTVDKMLIVENVIRELLEKEGFLCCVNAATCPTDVKSMEIEFWVPLEQTTIYGLIVDEQKQLFHEKMASYLHAHQTDCSAQEPSLSIRLWEEGFHWDRAGYWSRALRAYLMAAKKCKQEGQSLRCAESTFMAYQIYQNIEQEVAIVTFPEQCYSFADRMARCLFQPTEDNLKVLETNADLIIALKTAQEVFEPDPPSIVDAIELHILLAEVYLYRWEDFGEVMRLLSVAVLLAVASIWRPSFAIGSNNPSLVLSSKTNSRKSTKSTNTICTTYTAPKKFLRQEDYIHLFSLMAYVSRFISHESVVTVSFENAQAFLKSSDKHEGMEIDSIHVKAAISFRYLQAGKYSRAASLLDQALQEYRPAEHSQALISRYSADFVPYAVALLSQALMSGCDLSAGLNYWQRALTCLQSVSHYYSRIITITVLMSTVHFVGDYRGLLTLLETPVASSNSTSFASVLPSAAPASATKTSTLAATVAAAVAVASASTCSATTAGDRHLSRSSFDTTTTPSTDSKIMQLSKLWLRLKVHEKEGSSVCSFDGVVERFLQLCRNIDDQLAGTVNGRGEHDASAREKCSPPSPLLRALSSPLSLAVAEEPLAGHRVDICMSKVDFLEFHGCALERLYIEIACSLWPKANKSQLYALEERIQSSLHILLQSPIYDTMSVLAKGYNMLHSLSPILQTSESENGLSAGAIYVAVTERAEQPLLTLLNQLMQRDVVCLALVTSAVVKRLPLHDSIKESYLLSYDEAKGNYDSLDSSITHNSVYFDLFNRFKMQS